MITFLVIAVIVLAAIDIYFYVCMVELLKALKIINENTKLLKENLIEVIKNDK